MAITHLSDIVLDVARAADPAKLKAAAERLARMGRTAVPHKSMPSSLPPSTLRSGPALSQSNVYSQFEVFVLQSFIEAMLPKEAEAVFGRGSAGEIWKSMLAEKLAVKIVESGGLGIAERVTAVSASYHAASLRRHARPESRASNRDNPQISTSVEMPHWIAGTSPAMTEGMPISSTAGGLQLSSAAKRRS